MGDNGSRRPGQTTCPNIASSQLILAATGSARKMSSARAIKKPSNQALDDVEVWQSDRFVALLPRYEKPRIKSH
jgi:hypothetical protein